jgi:hypothetical protein
MGTRAEAMVAQFNAFNDELLTIIENCSDETWNRVLEYEDWPVGVTFRHVVAGHYLITDMAAMIIRGEALPDITMNDIVAMGNQHAQEHAACTREEVLGLLQSNSTALVEFIEGLSDEELGRSAYFTAVESEVSAEQLISFVIFQSAREHLENLSKVVSSS